MWLRTFVFCSLRTQVYIQSYISFTYTVYYQSHHTVILLKHLHFSDSLELFLNWLYLAATYTHKERVPMEKKISIVVWFKYLHFFEVIMSKDSSVSNFSCKVKLLNIETISNWTCYVSFFVLYICPSKSLFKKHSLYRHNTQKHTHCHMHT